ncbi:hypothetical protein A2U01_0112386, partial [Trifolium medium]|nr:hypothetical protein [Trifolium medium]
QWDQSPVTEATWEDMDTLQDKFPFLNLEDKVAFNGKGIVMRPNITTKVPEEGDSAKSQRGP